MSVIGIDFGTLNCVISQAKRGGIDTVLNEGSKRQTAALVSFQGKQRFMGEAAVPLVSSNFKNTVAQVKRLIGKSWSDPTVQRELEFLPNRKFYKEIEGDRIGIEVHYMDEPVVLAPEDVCAMLMGSLKHTAEYANDGRPVGDVLFSVPGYWNDRQRRAMLNSARIANVNVLGLINDGTAAALSYGIWKSASNQFDAEKQDYVMFVDMGYASMQVTIAAFVQGKLQIVASAADPNLGGRDIDMLLTKHFAKQFQEKHKDDPMTNAKSFLKLNKACEKLKQTLTPEGVNLANLNVEYLMNEIDFASKLSIEEFDEIIAPLVDRLETPLVQAMEMSGLTMDQISAVEIIGGSTRVRAIKRKIAQVLNLDTSKPNYGLSTTQNADECVSRGCALRCAMLSPAFRVKEFVVSDTVVHPITLTWEQTQAAPMEDEEEEEGTTSAVGENSIKIFAKGVEIPKTRRIMFRRREPFEIVASYDQEGKDAFPCEDDMLIGSFRISGMPEHEGDSLPRIRVDFKQDEFGLFQIVRADYMQEIVPEGGEGKEGGAEDKPKEGEAKDAESKEDKPKKKKFKPVKLQVEASFNHGRHEDEIMNARAREEGYQAHDKVLRETSECKNKLESYVYTMRDKLDYGLKEFTTEEERSDFAKTLQAAEDWLYDEGEDETKHVYQTKLADLKKVGDKFESRQRETEERPAACDRLRDEISANLKVVNSPDEQYAHIEEEERQKVRDICEEAEKWLEDKLKEQADKNLFEDPVITASDILARASTVNLNCRPIVTKRKPAPKKEESKAEEKKDSEEADKQDGEGEGEGKGDEGKESGGMDVDGEKQENDMDVD